METYLPAAKKSWFDFYSENRAARRDDPAHVRKEFLRGHELAQPTPAEVWDDPAKTNLLALTNSVKGGMSNVRLDDIEPSAGSNEH